MMNNMKTINFEQYLYALTINSLEDAEDTKRIFPLLQRVKDADNIEDLRKAKLALANKLMFINMMSRRLTGAEGFISWDMATEDPETGERIVTDEAKLELADIFLESQK